LSSFSLRGFLPVFGWDRLDTRKSIPECLNQFEWFSVRSLLCRALAPCQLLGIRGAAGPSGLV
jgi:hypothetical protein